MRSATTSRLLFAMLISFVLCGSVTAAERQAYVVTLKQAAAVDEPKVVAEQLATTYAGELAKPLPADGDAFVMHLSRARARLLTADPRVASVVPMAADPVPNAVETVKWSGGVPIEYDRAGNVKKVGNDAFAYDKVGRLAQANISGYTTTYQYDGFGNRTKCLQAQGGAALGDCQSGFTVDTTGKQNRLNEAGYDARGNTTSLAGRVYSWDAVDTMTREQIGGVAREFVYTADDKRIAVHTVNTGSWRWTARDPSGKVFREFQSQNQSGSLGTGSWQWSKDYIWRDGQLLASRQPVDGKITTYHYHLDHLGTARRITDSGDNIIGVHDYFAFGPEVPGGTNEPSIMRMKFTGHERDSGLTASPYDPDYMLARYYSPMLGRFLSVDPAPDSVTLANPQSWNRYSYALNNPINIVDPTGLKPCKVKVYGQAAQLNGVVDGTEVDAECFEAKADPVEEVPEDQTEAQVTGILVGQDMARFYLSTTVDNLTPEVLKGSYSYFRGIGRGANYLARVTGLRGPCEQQNAQSEAFWLGTVALVGSPELMAEAGKRAIGENKGFIVGRVGTGALVTIGLGRVGGGNGARAGASLGVLAVLGDVMHLMAEVDEDMTGRTPCGSGTTGSW